MARFGKTVRKGSPSPSPKSSKGGSRNNGSGTTRFTTRPKAGKTQPKSSRVQGKMTKYTCY